MTKNNAKREKITVFSNLIINLLSIFQIRSVSQPQVIPKAIINTYKSCANLESVLLNFGGTGIKITKIFETGIGILEILCRSQERGLKLGCTHLFLLDSNSDPGFTCSVSVRKLATKLSPGGKFLQVFCSYENRFYRNLSKRFLEFNYFSQNNSLEVSFHYSTTSLRKMSSDLYSTS